MKLGEREQRILNILQQSANLSIANIAREVGTQHHTVRNILDVFQRELGIAKKINCFFVSSSSVIAACPAVLTELPRLIRVELK